MYIIGIIIVYIKYVQIKIKMKKYMQNKCSSRWGEYREIKIRFLNSKILWEEKNQFAYLYWSICALIYVSKISGYNDEFIEKWSLIILFLEGTYTALEAVQIDLNRTMIS